MEQGVILTFKSYYLENEFHKAIATIDSDSFDGSMKSNLKASWKQFIILDVKKDILIHRRGPNIIHRILEEVDFNPYDDFERFKIPVKEVTTNMVEITRELGLEVDPE